MIVFTRKILQSRISSGILLTLFVFGVSAKFPLGRTHTHACRSSFQVLLWTHTHTHTVQLTIVVSNRASQKRLHSWTGSLNPPGVRDFPTVSQTRLLPLLCLLLLFLPFIPFISSCYTWFVWCEQITWAEGKGKGLEMLCVCGKNKCEQCKNYWKKFEWFLRTMSNGENQEVDSI